jgi:hypothetical protein
VAGGGAGGTDCIDCVSLSLCVHVAPADPLRTHKVQRGGRRSVSLAFDGQGWRRRWRRRLCSQPGQPLLSVQVGWQGCIGIEVKWLDQPVLLQALRKGREGRGQTQWQVSWIGAGRRQASRRSRKARGRQAGRGRQAEEAEKQERLASTIVQAEALGDMVQAGDSQQVSNDAAAEQLAARARVPSGPSGGQQGAITETHTSPARFPPLLLLLPRPAGLLLLLCCYICRHPFLGSDKHAHLVS